MAKRYIDAERIDFSPLIDDFDRARAKVIIMGQPTADVVDVVRCKNCKHFKSKGTEFLVNDIFGNCEKSSTGLFDDGEEVYGNDFCSYGERKTDNEQV